MKIIHLHIQPSLFETEPKKPSRNNVVAFGVTKTGLKKGNYGVLKDIFYGMYNLDIPLDMLIMQNPAEILSEYFAAGGLKRRDRHLTPDTPRNFLELVNYINRYSYDNPEFAALTHNFRNFFSSSPGKQKERLGSLENNIGDDFIRSFFNYYRYSNTEEEFIFEFYDPNWDGRDKRLYVNRIYEKLKSLSEGAKGL